MALKEQHHRVLSPLFAIAVLASACRPHESSGEIRDLNQPASGIIGGEPTRQDQEPLNSTVALYDEKRHSTCTGSLIAPDTVLTAAHCVDPSSKEITVLFQSDIRTLSTIPSSHKIRSNRFLRHPDYREDHTEGEKTSDLALVHLPTSVPEGFEPVKLPNTLDWESLKKGPLKSAGFGYSNGFFRSGLGILRQATLHFRKEHSETEFETEQTDTGVCSGDSGGPLFLLKDDHWIQIGVASRVATKFLGCRNYAVYTRTDIYLEWIQATAEKMRN